MLIVALVVAAASGIVGCLAGGCLGATLAWRLAKGKPPLPPLPSPAQIPAAVAAVLRGGKGTQPAPPPQEPPAPARRGPPALQA